MRTVTLLAITALVSGTVSYGLVSLVPKESDRCVARWKESGAEAKWSKTAGCLVKLRDKWVPEKQVVFKWGD